MFNVAATLSAMGLRMLARSSNWSMALGSEVALSSRVFVTGVAFWLNGGEWMCRSDGADQLPDPPRLIANFLELT
ncbi:hypothetical protein GCM10011577_18860 [Pseudarthrobacter polychromogenes]|uniref:Secreted protein n=1 Tax=Pseudarthrobacter polychromogenes TaxID=1676 RepID=A0ABQ1XK75_9MICC|nr:hypothetical protein GCM10011577_18860 [Pseudarthrobacter polychromogenes]